MARDHARVNVAIWGDPNFRGLPPAAQHLYLLLWTSPDLSYCGVHDWRPGRLTGLASGWSRQEVETAAMCLRARHFLVVDDDTEEALIRSWIRWDGLMKQPRMAISCITAYASVASETLRRVLVHQLAAEQKREPDLKCWADQRVQEVLSHPSVSAKELPAVSDPFRDGFTSRFGCDLDQTQSKVWGSVSVPPTPAPAPAPLLRLQEEDESSSLGAPDKSDASSRGSRIPDDFAITDQMRKWASEKVPDMDIDFETEKFINHWTAESGSKAVKRDWAATWRNWMLNAVKFAQRDGRAPAPAAPRRKRVNQWRYS